MSKIARRLLGKSNEGSDLLKVVFTPVKQVPRATAKVSKKKPEWWPSRVSESSTPTPALTGKPTRQKRSTKRAEPVTRQKRSTKRGEPVKATPSGIETRRKRRTTAIEPPEVVNEQLLDDVLQYLTPTLEQYKGCTLIDLYPGSCLWSRKVHDFLKPKCHLLLEPEAQYQAVIDDLVRSQGSTYKHIPLAGGNEQHYEDTYDRIFADDGPLPCPHPAPDSSTTLETNRSLLIIGSLNRRNDLKFHGKQYSGSLSSLYHLSWGALLNAYMHRQGPVRMLLWTLEKERARFLPEWSTYRTRTDAATNIAMHVQTAVAVDSVVSREFTTEWSIRSRWSGLSALRERIVQDTMKRLGMKVPEGRRIFHQLAPQSLEQSRPENAVSPYEVRYTTRAEVESALGDLIHHWNTRATARQPVGTREKPDQLFRVNRRRPDELYKYLMFPGLADALLENPSKAFKGAQRARAREEQGIQPRSLSKTEAELTTRLDQHETHTGLTGIDIRTAFFADAALRGINLEMHCAILEEQGIDVVDLKKRVMEFSDRVVEYVRRRKQVYETDFNRLVGDWTAFFTTPPLLGLDQRQYHPLQASSEDFWPQKNLTLLDFSPTNRDLAVPGLADRRTVALACQSIVKFLYSHKSRTVPTVLERLAPNAASDLISLVPAITDPRKGGRLDPKHLKVKQLTSDMLEGLAKAWFEWPFRPEGWELDIALSESSSSGAGNMEPLTPEAVTADDEDEAVY